MVAAYEGREQARKEREEYLKAHPPQPQDSVIRYAFTTRPLPQASDQEEEGGER